MGRLDTRTRPDHEGLHGVSGHGSERERWVAPLARGCSRPAAARAFGVTGEPQPVASERRVETSDQQGAFPRLSEEQIESLAVGGTRRATRPGEILYREGDPTCDFLVILDGLVAVVEGLGAGEQVVAVHGPGRFLGELSLLTGQLAHPRERGRGGHARHRVTLQAAAPGAWRLNRSRPLAHSTTSTVRTFETRSPRRHWISCRPARSKAYSVTSQPRSSPGLGSVLPS